MLTASFRGAKIAYGVQEWAQMMDGSPMQDPRLNPQTNPMPFDGERMIFGGFAPVVTLEK